MLSLYQKEVCHYSYIAHPYILLIDLAGSSVVGGRVVHDQMYT